MRAAINLRAPLASAARSGVPGLAISLALLASGCSWTTFDDLESETWVRLVTEPNDDSSDFGIALARGVRGGGALPSFIALGNAEVVWHELTMSPTGAIDASPGHNLSDAGSVANLDAQPLLISDSDPDEMNDEVTLITPSNGADFVLFSGTGASTTIRQLRLGAAAKPDAATYMTAPTGVATAGTRQPLIAAGAKVWGFQTEQTGHPSCTLHDGGTPIEIRGLVARGDTVVVWAKVGATGRLLKYPADEVFAGTTPGCMMGLNPQEVATTTFAPGRGSQILLAVEGTRTYGVLVGHGEPGDAQSAIELWDLTDATPGPKGPPVLTGGPVTTPGLRTAALLEAGGTRYVIAGYPDAIVDSVAAGQAIAYPISLTTGVGSTPAMTLYDASPESRQQFGRAVAVARFNGQDIVAVGADNEVFVYFRTTLYGETRQ